MTEIKKGMTVTGIGKKKLIVTHVFSHKRRQAQLRNHLIMRMHGAYSLFESLEYSLAVTGQTQKQIQDNKIRIAVTTINQAINSILESMNALHVQEARKKSALKYARGIEERFIDE